MKKVLFIIAAGVLLFAGCGSDSSEGDSVSISATESGFDGTSIGNKGTLNLTDSGQSLTMVYANDSTSMEFPTGENDSGEEELTKRFWIAETETTNAVVAAVLQWAKDNNRIVETSGAHNEVSSTTVKYGNQELVDLDDSDCHIDYDKTTSQFTADAGYTDHPAVEISWYGAVMICNWLTEMRDGNTDNLVYTGIDANWDHTETSEDRTKNGFRLPGEWEWEYAGRYRGNDSTNTVDKTDTSGNLLYTNPYFTKGNSASGATADYNDADACKAVAWYYENSGTGGSTSNRSSHPVGGKAANTLGLYDMSGNVFEWCFDDYDDSGSDRVTRGGSWFSDACDLQLGYRNDTDPSITYYNIGFRLCRTAD